MTLDTYQKAHDMQDLGSLTEACPKCGRQTKIRDFNWTGKKPILCRDCDPDPKEQTP